jgi:hypothetical protein
MADIIIPGLDDAVIVQLKRRAWHLGLPFEEAMRRLVIESIDSDELEPVAMLSYNVVRGKHSARRVHLHS